MRRIDVSEGMTDMTRVQSLDVSEQMSEGDTFGTYRCQLGDFEI